MAKRVKTKEKTSELDPRLVAYKKYLAERKLKFTNQRKVIISEFLRAGGHISTEELFRLVKRKSPGLGLASVYRTINSMVEAGLAKERRFLDKSSVYEISDPNGHHDHLICLKCRKIFEFENDKIESLQKEVATRLGFSLQDHKLELYGWCERPKCPNL